MKRSSVIGIIGMTLIAVVLTGTLTILLAQEHQENVRLQGVVHEYVNSLSQQYDQVYGLRRDLASSRPRDLKDLLGSSPTPDGVRWVLNDLDARLFYYESVNEYWAKANKGLRPIIGYVGFTGAEEVPYFQYLARAYQQNLVSDFTVDVRLLSFEKELDCWATKQVRADMDEVWRQVDTRNVRSEAFTCPGGPLRR